MAGKNTVEIILSAKDEASRALREAYGSVEESNNKFLGTIMSGKALIAGAFTALGGYIAKTGVEYDAMAEQSQVAWTTLLGSQSQAKDMMKDIANFAKATPFETKDVDMMAKYLHNAGLEGKGMFDQLMKVSDVASAFNIPIDSAEEMTRQMSQVIQSGTAYTEDINILQDRGVPIYKALAQQLGVTTGEVKKMASEGKITSDVYMKAFNSVAGSVKGASDAQSQTFSGLMSTMKDDWEMISGELSKPLFALMKKGLDDLMPILDKFLGGVKSGGLVGGLEAIFPPSISTTIDRVKTGIQGIFNLFKGDSMAGNNALRMLGFDENTISVIDSTIDTIKSTVKSFFDYYVKYFQTEWAVIIGVFKGAWDIIVRLFSGNNDLGGSFIKIFNTIKNIALPILQDAFAFIKKELDVLKKFWAENGDQIIQAVKNFVAILVSIFQFLASILGPIIQIAWETVKKVFSAALDIIMGLIKVFAGVFTGDWSKVWEGVKEILSGAWNGITSIISGALKAVWSLVSSVFTDIGNAIKGPIDEAVNFVKDGIDKIKGFFSNLGSYIPSPHFDVTMGHKNIMGADVPWPDFNFKWYDKGGVFYGPQVIGVGEKRPEFVGALDDLRKIVKEETGGKGKGGNTYHITVNKEETANQLVRELQRLEWLYA